MILAIVFTISMIACNNYDSTSRNIRQDDVTESLIKVNKHMVKIEEEDINDFIGRYNYKMSSTGTGLRYQIDSVGYGRNVRFGDIVRIRYKVRLLTGDVIYDSDSTGPKEFVVGKGGVESGLEEGILLLRNGDRAKFVLPSHLAFGLLGDNDKVPPKASIVYDLQVVDLQ